MASRDSKQPTSSVEELHCQGTLVDSESGLEPGKIDEGRALLPFWRGVRHSFVSRCTNWWLIEILCWCLGALCTIAIATILSVWNGRPLPSSFPLGLKLNAYVSVLSAIAKLTLAVPLEEALSTQKYLWYTTRTPKHSLIDFERFELADRRPIGALRLIWRLRTR
jgi:hypothetical protein